MRTYLDCLPCLVRQALEAARFVTRDAALQARIMRDVLQATAVTDLAHSPPSIAREIHRRVRKTSRVDDPYREQKDLFNRMAMKVRTQYEARIREAADPLALAVRLAIAGNVIDLGVKGGLTVEDAHGEIERSLAEPLHGDLAGFRDAVAAARSILYLTDNAGEIALDRLLVERLPVDRVTVVVRGRPIINDATRIDAREVGLDALVEVVDNGSDAPGTILDDCGREFLERYRGADLIIAKGQGNFETLNDDAATIFFLFKVKCPVVSSHVGLPVGSHVLTRSHAAPSGERRH